MLNKAMIRPVSSIRHFVFLLCIISTIHQNVLQVAASNWGDVVRTAIASSLPSTTTTTSQPTCPTQTQAVNTDSNLQAAYNTDLPDCTTTVCDFSNVKTQIINACNAAGGSTWTATLTATFTDANLNSYTNVYQNVAICIGNLCDVKSATNVFHNYAQIVANNLATVYLSPVVQYSGAALASRSSSSASAASTGLWTSKRLTVTGFVVAAATTVVVVFGMA